MSNEADTWRKFVLPKLQATGWDNEPHSIAEQRYFIDSRNILRNDWEKSGAAVPANLQHAIRHRQSILTKAFTGNLL